MTRNRDWEIGDPVYVNEGAEYGAYEGIIVPTNGKAFTMGLLNVMECRTGSVAGRRREQLTERDVRWDG